MLLALHSSRKVGLDRLQEIICAAIMQKEQPLPDAPQRRCSKHVSGCRALGDVVRQALAHVMD